MGFFSKKPMDRWADDAKAVVDNDRKTFTKIVKVDRTKYAVIMANGREGMVGCDGRSVYFTMCLENIRDVAGRCGIPVSAAYRQLMSMMNICTIAVDGNYDMHVSSMVPENYYDAGSMADGFYRWAFCVMDYENALNRLIDAYRRDA